MQNTTYSFTDTIVTFSHQGWGQITANGAGLGNIAVAMTTDRTSHDVAADGSVMVSKIAGRNGTIAINVQQTSVVGKQLTKLFNYLVAASAEVWAQLVVTINNSRTGDLITATGVSPQKQADKQFQAQGQQITWNFMAADIQQD
jgi:hypothetical protein